MQGEGLEYQWFKDDQPLPVPPSSPQKLRIEAPSVNDSGRYYATVSNAAGSVRSVSAVVHVAPPLDLGTNRPYQRSLTPTLPRRRRAASAGSSASGELPRDSTARARAGSAAAHPEPIAENAAEEEAHS